MKAIATLFFTLTFVGSCTSLCGKKHASMQPEEVVEAYLDVALNMSSISEREKLLSFTTGNLKEAIAKASDATIQAAYVSKNYHLERYSVVERRDRTPIETEITFELVYRELAASSDKNPADVAQITTENTLRVVKENKLWLLDDVLNKKSSFDFPLAMKSEIVPCAKDKVTPEDQGC